MAIGFQVEQVLVDPLPLRPGCVDLYVGSLAHYVALEVLLDKLRWMTNREYSLWLETGLPDAEDVRRHARTNDWEIHYDDGADHVEADTDKHLSRLRGALSTGNLPIMSKGKRRSYIYRAVEIQLSPRAQGILGQSAIYAWQLTYDACRGGRVSNLHGGHL